MTIKHQSCSHAIYHISRPMTIDIPHYYWNGILITEYKFWSLLLPPAILWFICKLDYVYVPRVSYHFKMSQSSTDHLLLEGSNNIVYVRHYIYCFSVLCSVNDKTKVWQRSWPTCQKQRTIYGLGWTLTFLWLLHSTVKSIYK